jgi:hypothetical protein
MAAAAAEMGGGCFGSEGISHSIKSKICKSILGMRVPRIQNGMVRVPCIRIGDNLAQIKANRLANVQTFGSQCFASKQSKKESWLRGSQIYRGAQIEKWSFIMCSCVISHRNHDFTERLCR